MRSAIRYAATEDAIAVGQSWRTWLVWVPGFLEIAAGLLSLFALADWWLAGEEQASSTTGVAICLTVDRSGSMRRDDVVLDGERLSRLEATRRIATDVLLDRRAAGTRSADRRDLVGVVSFAGQPRLDAVPQSDLRRAAIQLARLRPSRSFRDDGTAIGDAIVAAVDALQEATDSATPRPDRLVILVTDGQQTGGQRSVREAAAAAEQAGVSIFAVALAPSAVASIDAWKKSNAELREAATRTSGRWFEARTADDLRAIFAAIDSERAAAMPDPVRLTRRYRAVDRFRWGSLWCPPLLVIATGLVVAAALLRGAGWEVAS